MGGQGMNTGIQDAYNSAWKLALVHRGRAPEGLLDSYEKERRPAAEDVLTTTKMLIDRFEAFSHLLHPNSASNCTSIWSCHRRLGRMAQHLEQLDLNYTKSPICHQHEGSYFGKTRFTAGPRLGEEAPDAKPLLHDDRPRLYSSCYAGPKYTLLLFPGADHEDKSWHRLATELAQSVESASG